MTYSTIANRKSDVSKAFTIVELLIVIVVIALLATLGVLGYSGVQERAVEVSMKADLESASGELESRRLRNGKYPATATDLQASGSNVVTYFTLGDSFCADVSAPKAQKQFHYLSTERRINEGSCAMSIDGWKEIATTDTATCAITLDNLIYCWGTSTTTPTALGQGAIPAGAQLSSLSGGTAHFCVVADQKGYCWGTNTNGRLGDGTTVMRSTPVEVVRGTIPTSAAFISISAGGNSSCALLDSNVYCWGNGASGALGRGSTVSSSTPVAVSQFAPSSTTAVKAWTGGSNGCALSTDNLPYCWGAGTLGALGNGGTAQSSIPVQVAQGDIPAGEQIASISVGTSHSCAITTNRGGYCWGSGSNGRLGRGGIASSSIPVAVAGSMQYSVLKAGATLSCGITTAAETYCWGYNNNGQLGNGGIATSQLPVVVSQGQRAANQAFIEISPSSTHTCGITADRKAYCWGANNIGQLGNGTTAASDVPALVSSID